MKSKKENNKGGIAGMAIGGMTMLGLGVGFFLLETSALWFLASIMGGIGLGLLLAALIAKDK